MILKGKGFKFGDNINTDSILPAKYLSITDEKILGSHCMEGIDPAFSRKITQGDIIIGGSNFGCGSSREQAPLAIKGCGIPCVIAKSFARIFYRNAFNTGLLLLECPDFVEDFQDCDIIEGNIKTGILKNLSSGKDYMANPIPPFIQEITNDGGLIPHIMKKRNLA